MERVNLMPKVFLSSALALLGLSAPALAMPLPPFSDTTPGLTLVANGCGGGWHRNFNGVCVPNGGYVAPAPGVVVGAPGVVVGAPGVAVAAPSVVVGPHPYHRCWWRPNGVRVCN
jgi:hypothetical protein